MTCRWRIVLCAIVLCGIQSLVYSQHTVGLIQYDFSKTLDGYNLIFPHNQSTVFLLNNCGEIVHTWEDDPLIRPGNSVILMENGDLIKCSRHNTVTDDVIWAGGGGEFIEIRDWDNALKWKYTLNDSLQRLHHDIALTPEGTILAIVWERKVSDVAIAAGRDTALLEKGELWSEAVLEIRPVADSFEIVWEWHVWDHMIQDFDASKDNYGVISEHPELVNINWGDNLGSSSWMHCNAIDYNPVLDQILISIPTFNEIWILDHSTTTAEASGHSGGLSGRGGDLMFRWGNPAVYGRGDASDETLFFQHNAHWVDAHLDPTHPQFGKIVVYNNRVGADSSTVNILNPLFLDYAWMYGMAANNTFLPEGFDWTYSHPDKTQMFSGGLSSVQLLSNGNTLISAGMTGHAFEVTSNDEIVWEYTVPLSQGHPVAQGTVLNPNENTTWRMHRYPSDYPGLEGRDLSSKGFIELEPDTAFCDLSSKTSNPESIALKCYPNPVSETLTIDSDPSVNEMIHLTDNQGIIILSHRLDGGKAILEVRNIPSGMYMLQLENHLAVQKVIIQH